MNKVQEIKTLKAKVESLEKDAKEWQAMLEKTQLEFKAYKTGQWIKTGDMFGDKMPMYSVLVTDITHKGPASYESYELFAIKTVNPMAANYLVELLSSKLKNHVVTLRKGDTKFGEDN
jgi:hypothetical protein